MVNFHKIVELATAHEIATDMDLNVAAELLDSIDEKMKERVMTKTQKTKKSFNIPKYFYGTTSFIFTMGVIFFLIFNNTPELPNEKKVAKVYGYTDKEVVQEEQSEWLLPEQLSEYELGMNTVEYFEDMMPRVDNEEMQSRVDDIKDKLVQLISLRDGIDEIEITIVESDEIGAWALPGGFIILTDAFYRLCKTDDELASILGHEIAHIVHGHVNNPME